MESRDTQRNHNDRKGKLDMELGGGKTASTPQPEHDGLTQRTLQFVNTTGSVTLDEASKKEIRAQVMRDWHRRKSQQSIRNNPAARGTDDASTNVATTTTSTHRFRLSARSLLPRPPISSRPRHRPKDIQSPGFNQDRNLPLEPYENASMDVAIGSQGRKVMQTGARAESRVHTSEILQSKDAATVKQQWLFNLEYYFQTDTLYNEPSSGVLDPFNALSLLTTRRTQQLLHYYWTYYRTVNECRQSAWLLIPVREAYFAVTMHDEAFLNTAISFISGRQNARFGNEDPIESLQHQMEAMRILNQRMGDPIQSLTDGTFGAVANLALYEAANGSEHKMGIHMKGLHKMITMRGGLDKVHPYMQRLIAWADLNTSNAISKAPSFPVIGNWPTHNPDQALGILQGTPTITFDQLAATSTIDSLFIALRSLTRTLQQVDTHNLAHKHDIRISDELYYSQARLFAVCCHSYRTGDPLTTATTVSMLIYSHYCLRDTSFTFRIIALLVRNLKIELLKIPRQELLASVHRERFLWVLALGGMAAEFKEERGWFGVAFMKAVKGMGLGSWADVRRVLEGVLWMNVLDEPGRRLWVESGGDAVLDRRFKGPLEL